MTDTEIENLVVEHLRAHPEFFSQHLDLLDTMNLPHPRKGSCSLVEVQLMRQRNRIQQLEAELRTLSQLARQEPDIFFGLMPLQKSLSNCQSFADAQNVLVQWAKGFELQDAKILLFKDCWSEELDIAPHYWLDRKAFELIRLERFGLRQFYLGQMTNKEKSLLFLPQEFPIGSLACCLLGTKNSQNGQALLLFSARDERRFHNGQDISFLRHLVDILELHLSSWLTSL